MPLALSKPAALSTEPTEFDGLARRWTGFHPISAIFLIAWAANFGVWAKHSFGVWLTAAAQRLHHNVLATALANKLARIAWTVLAQGRSYEARVN
jgi:hypothetical protein